LISNVDAHLLTCYIFRIGGTRWDVTAKQWYQYYFTNSFISFCPKRHSTV